MEGAVYLCGRVGIIDHGRIIALDPPDSLKNVMAVDMPKKPTLEDVFIHYTGRAIREEEASPADAMRLRKKSGMGR